RNYFGLFVTVSGNGSLVNGKWNGIGKDINSGGIYPGSLSITKMITVGATDNNDNITPFSNWGSSTVDIFAPGVEILTTSNNNYFRNMSGTSFAAPHVAGVAALIKSKYPNLSSTQIKQAIMNGADPVASLADKCYSGGRLNAHQALLEAEKLLEPIGMVSGDFTGNGLDDIAYFYDLGNNSMAVKVAVNNGTTFTPQTWYTFNNWYYDLEKIRGRIVAGDFNGDGKTDIAVMYDEPGNNAGIHVWFSTGTSFEWQQNEYGQYHWYYGYGNFNAQRCTERMVSGDFNGDGKTDIATMYDYGNGHMGLHVWLSNGTIFIEQPINSWYYNPGHYDAQYVVGMVAGDFNGDGKADIVTMYDYGNGHMGLHVWLSNGTTFVEQLINSWYYNAGHYPAYAVVSMTSGDYNNDSLSDIAVFYCYGDHYKLHNWFSTGTSFDEDWWHWG
ncbi:MAG: FG-GAP-like repeat-containing protein, partial [Firmicutes bacterium]|nr:FG-GAP-like repeat-containing protein [Bacillota bacterium]